MRTVDIIALIAYPGIIINTILTFVYFSKSVIFQIKNKVITWLISYLFFATIFFCGMQLLLTMSRYLNLTGETSQAIRDWYGIISMLFFFSYSAINFLLYAKKTDRLIDFNRERKDD